MGLETLKIIFSAAIPLVLFYFGYRFERNQNRKEGKHRTRIQFELEAVFFGPQEGFYVAEVTMLLHNKGLVRNIVKSLNLEILGIKAGAEINEFEKKSELKVHGLKKAFDMTEFQKKSIAEFPVDIVKTSIRHEKGKFFVEPSITQQFTHVARVQEDIRFILVRSSFKYHNNSEHTAQKVFEVDPKKVLDKNQNV